MDRLPKQPCFGTLNDGMSFANSLKIFFKDGGNTVIVSGTENAKP